MTRRKISTLSLDFAQELLGDIRALIESARQRATAMVNSELTLLFWRIGRRIHTEVLAGERAGYGEQMVPAVAAQLTRDYGAASRRRACVAWCNLRPFSRRSQLSRHCRDN